MRFGKVAAVALLGLGLGVTAASAEDSITVVNCLSMADQVKVALGGNENSSNFEAARKERMYGQEFCTNGNYARGVAHYTRALQLLGVAQKN